MATARDDRRRLPPIKAWPLIKRFWPWVRPHIGYGIDPFGQAADVPQFPEKSADERGETEAENAPPVTGFHFREKGSAPQRVERHQQE